ncbi:hypothetical protein AALP_AAs73268U000400 [Arabis alpina]|uniref:Uncharacterized protein n=1 Tax=Arabis alpina TaxID=50452 RepID=A0A087G3K4_ARAAL|nr:hypothetical protein AALP_AAs73268U000400 [Arabis alpina]
MRKRLESSWHDTHSQARSTQCEYRIVSPERKKVDIFTCTLVDIHSKMLENNKKERTYALVVFLASYISICNRTPLSLLRVELELRKREEEA